MKSLSGQLLVAAPELPDINFYQSVVLLIHHDDEGAFGLVLNRPMENSIKEIWSVVADTSCDIEQPINLGGPVSGPLMALHTNAEYSETEILPGVYMATQKDSLNAIVQQPELPFRIFNGYAGWASGQLESELQAGGWMLIPAKYDYIFDDSDSLWKRVSQDIGKHVTDTLLDIWTVPDDPSMN